MKKECTCPVCGKRNSIDAFEKMIGNDNNTILENEGTEDLIIENGVVIGYEGNQREAIIPNYVHEIGESAFSDHCGLTSVTIPDSVTKISDFAFNYCMFLTNITVPYSVNEIGLQAFAFCDNLKSISFPNSDAEIWHDAVLCCSNLTEIIAPGRDKSQIESWMEDAHFRDSNH